MRVVFVGAGNLATRLSLEMRKSGMSIGQVYSHTSEHAKILADELGCGWTVIPEEIVEDADLYVFSLKDAVLQDVIARVKPNNGLWVHTAGSMPISVFEGLTARYGVVYPLQTFSKSREVDFKKIPFFLEANSSEDEKVLGEVAGDFVKSETVDKMTESCKRLLAMVCQGNFTMGSLEETIRAITSDAKIQATLRKKLKGRYEKDKALLEKVAGLPEQEASDWAFLAAEVINWEWLAQVLEAAGWEGTTQEAIDIIRAAVIVEEGMKVGVEAEQPEV